MRDTDGQVKTLMEAYINDYRYLVFRLDKAGHVKTVCGCISGAPLSKVRFKKLSRVTVACLMQ